MNTSGVDLAFEFKELLSRDVFHFDESLHQIESLVRQKVICCWLLINKSVIIFISIYSHIINFEV